MTDDKLTKWNVNPVITQSCKKGKLRMFSLLITSAELVLPSIFVMADKPDQIPPRLFLLEQTPKRIQDLSFSRYTFVFFFPNITISLSILCIMSHCHYQILSSLLFRLAKYAINNPIIHKFYSHILKRNLFATKCDNDVITVQKFTSGQCVCEASIQLHHTQQTDIKAQIILFEKEMWFI